MNSGSPDFAFSATMKMIFGVLIGFIVMKDIHVPLKMNCNTVGDPLILHVEPSWGKIFNLSSTFVYDHTCKIKITLPSASATVCVFRTN